MVRRCNSALWPSNSCLGCVVYPPPALPPTICLCFPVAVRHPPPNATLRWARIRYRKWRHGVALESATGTGGVQFETGSAKFPTRADADTDVKMTADRAATVPKWHRVRAAYFLKSSAKLLQCSQAEAVAKARLPRPLLNKHGSELLLFMAGPTKNSFRMPVRVL